MLQLARIKYILNLDKFVRLATQLTKMNTKQSKYFKMLQTIQYMNQTNL